MTMKVCHSCIEKFTDDEEMSRFAVFPSTKHEYKSTVCEGCAAGYRESSFTTEL